MKEFLQIVFGTSDEKTKTIRVPNHSKMVPVETLISGAGKMVTGNIFDLNGASLEKLNRLEAYAVTTTKLI